MKVTTVRREFIDSTNRCGLGCGARFKVALTSDCDDEQTVAELKEVFFREIIDGNGWLVYSAMEPYRSQPVTGMSWCEYDAFVRHVAAANWGDIERAALASRMNEIQRNEEGYYDEF